MVRSFVFAFFYLILIFTWSEAFARSKVVLSQKSVADMILKQSTRVQEVELKYQQYRLNPILARSDYDWKLTLETGNETDKSQTASNAAVSTLDLRRNLTTANVTKSFLTGTTLAFNLSRTSIKSDPDFVSSGNGATILNPNTADNAGITLEQSLWGNFFGIGDRAKIRSAEKNYQAQLLLRRDELQNAVLEGLGLFWKAYVAQENFNESVNSRNRYDQLVSAVRRKSSLGNANPGELSQVLAENETRIQTVKTASLDYLKAVADLITFLNLNPDDDLVFDVPKNFPDLPVMKKMDTSQLRVVRSQKLKSEAAEDAYKEAESRSSPNLSLVARYNATGVDEKSTESLNEVTSGRYPKTYVGVKFQYNFGTGIQDEQSLNKKLSFQLEEIRSRQQLLQIQDNQNLAERKVESTYSLAQSSLKQRELREKAVSELNRTFNQGRTDISVLIEAMNKFFTSEVATVRAIGDYYIALNEWAAARDELIPETGGNTK